MLKYLLKDSGMNCTGRQRLQMAYFSALSVVASLQQAMKLNEKATMMKLTGILHHFAGTMGESVDQLAVSTVAV